MIPLPLVRLRRKIAFYKKDERALHRCSNIMASRNILPLLKQRFDEDIPPTVNVEITTECNYRCRFCPQSSYGREVKYITKEAFEFLVGRLKDIDYGQSVVLYVNNEPFLHPQLMEFCALIARELPRSRTIIESNGSLITEGHLKYLSGLTNPVALTINDYTPDRAIAGRLKQWFERLERKDNIALSIKLRSWKENISNRAGNQPVSRFFPGDYRDIVCTWPFISLLFNASLQAFLCCSDYRNETIMGDLRKNSIMEIWKSEKYRDIRRKMLSSGRREIDLCRRCDAEWCSLPYLKVNY